MWKLMDNIIEKDDKQELTNFINSSDRLTNGPKVQEFENKWSSWLGTKKSVMINSGASGNFLTIALVKELFGTGEVIVPSLGWSSDVSSIIQLGMTPVFVDIDPQTLGINPFSLRKALGEETKAIVIVHALGFNAITPEIRNILDGTSVFIIEDCCESHGAIVNEDTGERIGTYGNVSIFSFYFGHHMTTVEGGMVSTNDENLYQLSKMLRSHGMTREASDEVKFKFRKDFPDLNPLFTFALPGFNFRSTELNAVLGLSQLKKLDQNIVKRKDNLRAWLENLDESKYKIDYSVKGNSNFALPLVLQEPDKSLKERVCNLLDSIGMEYRLGTAGGGNLSRQPFVKKYYHRIIDNQKIVDHIHDFGLYIGNGMHVSKEAILDVTTKLNKI